MARIPWWQRAYDLALHAFPTGFRERWSADMRATFADRVAHARRSQGHFPPRLLIRELRDVIQAGMRSAKCSRTNRCA